MLRTIIVISVVVIFNRINVLWKYIIVYYIITLSLYKDGVILMFIEEILNIII